MEVQTEGCRRLWTLIQGLPPEATLWTDLQRDDPSEAVTAPLVDTRPKLTDPAQIHEFLTKQAGGG